MDLVYRHNRRPQQIAWGNRHPRTRYFERRREVGVYRLSRKRKAERVLILDDEQSHEWSNASRLQCR
jgi:hypothetical protein